MGFLNQSTNIIIVDAVLTDLGRQFLSRNDGSFNIVKFALGDSEIIRCGIFELACVG